MDDTSPRHRVDAVWQLDSLDDQADSALASLVRIAQSDRSGWVRETAWGVIGTYGPRASRTVPALLAALAGPDSLMQQTIPYTLGRIGLDSLSPALVRQVIDALIYTAGHAQYGFAQPSVTALAWIGPAGVSPLVRLSETPNPAVQLPALELLVVAAQEGIRTPAARAMLHALGDPTGQVRTVAAHAIVVVGPAVLPALDSIARTGSAPTGAAVMTARQEIDAVWRSPVVTGCYRFEEPRWWPPLRSTVERHEMPRIVRFTAFGSGPSVTRSVRGPHLATATNGASEVPRGPGKWTVRADDAARLTVAWIDGSGGVTAELAAHGDTLRGPAHATVNVSPPISLDWSVVALRVPCEPESARTTIDRIIGWRW